MIFPAFLRPGDTVGITAPSAGVDPADTEFDFSLSVLRAAGYRIRESADVRSSGTRSPNAPESSSAAIEKT